MAIFRIEVTPEVFRIVESEAFLRCTTIKAVASEILAKYCSKEAIDLAGKRSHIVIKPNDQMTVDMCATKSPDSQETVYEECGTPQHSESKPKRKNLGKDDAALARIKEMWNAGEHNREAIAKAIDYPPSTVRERVRKMLDAGEIKEDRDVQPIDEQVGGVNNA